MHMALAPKASVSTNSTTRAIIYFLLCHNAYSNGLTVANVIAAHMTNICQPEYISSVIRVSILLKIIYYYL